MSIVTSGDDRPTLEHSPARGLPRPRRRVLMNAVSALAGAGLAAAGKLGYDRVTADDPLPFYGGYAATIHADRRTPPKSPRLDVVWSVDTAKRLIALTFDDGPAPQWTPQVLSILAEAKARATFFMLGDNARRHAGLVAGRLAEHEVGNHTWAHHDLARMTFEDSHTAIKRAHDELAKLTGREPTLLRPPYGHLAGSSMLAANELGYTAILWNRQMIESEFPDDPAGLTDYIVNSCTPGTILLAHDTGPADRLIAIRGLAATIAGLRRKGFEFVRVSELLAESAPRR